MALSSTQRFQGIRVPVPDGSVSSADGFALGGVVVTETTPTFTTTQLRQLARAPIADASLDTSDKYALAGAMESGGTGITTDIFSVEWFLDSASVLLELPQANDGALAAALDGVSTLFSGTFVYTPVLGGVEFRIDSLSFVVQQQSTDVLVASEANALQVTSQNTGITNTSALTGIVVKSKGIGITVTAMTVEVQ